MIVSLLLLVGVAVAVPVPEFKDALLGPDINLADPKTTETILQLINALGKRQVEDGWLEDLIAVTQLYGPIDSGIGRKRLEPVKARRILPPLLAALDPNILLEYLGKRQIEDNLWDDIVSVVTAANDYLTSPQFALDYAIGKRQLYLFDPDDIASALAAASDLLSRIGKRQIEDNLWDDIVNGVESAYEWLTSPEVLSVVNAASYPIGKRQVEDGLWEDVVNALVTVNDAINEGRLAYYTSIGKREAKRLITVGVITIPGIPLDPLVVGKRQVKNARAASSLVVLVDPETVINAINGVGKRQA